MKGFTLVELMVVMAFLGALALGVVCLIAFGLFGKKMYDAIPEAPPAQVLDVGGAQ